MPHRMSHKRNVPFAISIFVATATLIATCTVHANEPSLPTIGKIEILDSQLESWLSGDAKIEVLASGFTWTEGPVWVTPEDQVDGCDSENGCLLFSDIPRNTVFRWSPGQDSPGGGIDKFLSPSGYTGTTYYGLEPGCNGLLLDSGGRLVSCEHGDRRVSVLTPGGGKMTIVDRFEGKRLNSPNDAVFDERGNLFFTDPPYGLPDRANDPRRELDFCGVYRYSPNGELKLLTKALNRPNGIGLSPDQATLYVAQSDPDDPIWMAFPLNEDGLAGAGRKIADASEYMKQYPGLPDGMAIHSSGTLFASGPGGIFILSPTGDLLGRIITGGRTSNCTFDSDEKTLYLTADKQICRVRMK